MDDLFKRVGHACRTCLGPILEWRGAYVCAVCDAASSESVADICGCGITAAGNGLKLLGFKCVPNPARGPMSPAAVVIQFGTGFEAAPALAPIYEGQS